MKSRYSNDEIGIIVEWDTWSLAKRKTEERACARCRGEMLLEVVAPTTT